MSNAAPSAGPSPPRIGIVGAGRTRQGLGPYLARWFESAGCRVTAIAGRDAERTRAVAAELAAGLGHAVAVAADTAELARAVDALVVASPVPGHLAGLDAALAAGVPCLCEKPLVAAADRDAGLARIARFRAQGLLLEENCQWPFVLPALWQLHPELVGRPVRTVAMGLGPGWAGPAMVADSLSHVLSVVQALAEIEPDAPPADVRQTDGGPAAARNIVQFRLIGGRGPIDVALHLEHCPQQPRPAWLAVDGARIDRRLGPDYAISFVAADGRTANVQDPLRQLVYGFAANLPRTNRERITALADAVAVRLRLYAGVLDRLAAGSG